MESCRLIRQFIAGDLIYNFLKFFFLALKATEFNDHPLQCRDVWQYPALDTELQILMQFAQCTIMGR